jgi:O-antigen/teichoic acid export membrane protein
MAEGTPAGTFKRNVAWQSVGSASQTLLSGLVLLLMGRKLDAGGFGEFSIILGFVSVANLLVEPRMQDVAARQFWNLDRDEAARGSHRDFFVDLFAFEALCKLLPCAALILLSGPLVNVAHLPAQAATLIVVGAVGTYFAKLGFGLSVGVLRVLGRSDQFTYCATGELVLRLLLLLLLAGLSKLTVANSVVVQCLTGIVSNTLQLGLAARQLGSLGSTLRSWRPVVSCARLRQHRRTLLSNIGLSASDLMNKDLDITLLAPMIPSAQIGVYKMAKNIALLTWRAVDPFYIALMPELNRLISVRAYAETSRLLYRSSFGLAALAAALSLCTYLALAHFGEALLGPAFAETPGIMAWMLIGVVASAPLVWGHPLAVALNRADVAFIGSLVGSALGLGAFLALARTFGVHGAAIAWTLTFLPGFTFTSAVALRLLKRYKTKNPPSS